jgi:hypothetical protein
MFVVVASDHNHRKILAHRADRAEQRYSVSSVLEVDNGKIEITDAANDFQRITGIACEVAHAAESQEGFGDGILQFTVVRKQKHDWYLHDRILMHARIHTSQQLRIAPRFLFADFIAAPLPKASRS